MLSDLAGMNEKKNSKRYLLVSLVCCCLFFEI